MTRSRRRVRAVVLASVLGLLGPLALVPSPASAALPPDTMFSFGGVLVSGSALTTVRASATSLYLSGRAPVLTAAVSLTQPTDRPVAAGDVLDTSPAAAGPTTPRLVVSGVTCATPQPGRIAVEEATYDSTGVLQTLAARYAFACGTDDAAPLVAGELRLSSTAPFALGRAAFTPTASLAVAVGASIAVTAVVTNGGTVPVTPADVTLTAAPEVRAQIVTDGCTGTLLQPSGQCRVDLAVAPTARLSRAPLSVTAAVPELPGPGADVRGGSVTVSGTVTSDNPPVAPATITPTAGVDGVAVAWGPAAATSTTAAATSYDVHRSSPVGDRDFTGRTTTSLVDTGLPAGTTATYTVRGVNVYGTGAWSDPVSAVVPSWDGPYDPPRREMSIVWDEAVAGQSFLTYPAHLANGPGVFYTTYAAGRATFGDSYTSVSLPAAVADGQYDVGSAAGTVDVRATSGRACATPSGRLQVQHSAPSYTGGYASLSADADLLCGDGHHLRIELRWATPEPVHVLSAASTPALTAVWGRSAPGTVVVANTGSAPSAVEGVRLIDDTIGTAAPFAITGSTCAGAVLQPQETCVVSVRYTPVTGAWMNDYAVLVVRADLGETPVGELVGIPVASLGAPQEVRATGRPGHVDVSWYPPGGTDGEGIDSYRVEELGPDGSVTVLATTVAATTTADLGVLAEGPHRLRVVVRTPAGHESASDALTVTVPSRWLLTTDGHGVRTWDPAGTGTGGGQIGTDWLWAVASSPTREAIVVSTGYPHPHLELRDLDGATIRTLTDAGTGYDVDPAVSPDGARVAFTRLTSAGSEQLMVVPSAGGAAAAVPGGSELSSPAWTPDGRSLVASDDRDVTPVPGLVRVDVTTGARTSLAGTSGAWAVSVSRTGAVAYLLTDPVSGADQLRTTSAVGGGSTLVGGAQWLDAVVWDPTGRYLAVTGQAPWESSGTSWVYDTAAAAASPQRLSGGVSVAWHDPHSVAPIAGLSGSAFTGRSATLTIAASDADDAVGGLGRECQLDVGPWLACSPVWSLSGLAAGTHTASARVIDPSGQRSAVVSRTWTVDTTAPTARVTSIAPLATSSDLALRYGGVDAGGAGVASYDVRERYASYGGSLGGYVYPRTWQGTRATSLSARMSAGYEYCLSVRARDAAGNVGAWSADRCTVAAVDDAALAASTGWVRGRSSAYLSGTYSATRRAGAALSRTLVRGRQIGVVATTCPTCGSVDIYHGGVRLGSVSLVSSRATYRKVLWLRAGVTRYGTVVVKSTSSRSVVIDGIAVLH